MVPTQAGASMEWLKTGLNGRISNVELKDYRHILLLLPLSLFPSPSIIQRATTINIFHTISQNLHLQIEVKSANSKHKRVQKKPANKCPIGRSSMAYKKLCATALNSVTGNTHSQSLKNPLHLFIIILTTYSMDINKHIKFYL